VLLPESDRFQAEAEGREVVVRVLLEVGEHEDMKQLGAVRVNNRSSWSSNSARVLDTGVQDPGVISRAS
jgi:hypothetical protein